jgi:hypothetical protein
MAENITPSNPNIPTPPNPSGNVASLANKDTLSNLKNSASPKTFGDQVKKAATAKVIQAATQSTLAKLEKEKANLILEGIKLDKDHEKALAKIEIKHTPTKKIQNGQTVEVPAELSDSEYQVAVDIENKNYKEAQDNLQKRKDQNQKSIDDIKKDPFKKQKDAKKKRQDAKKKQEKKNKEEEKKAKKARNKSILQNARKSLVPIVSLLLTNKIADVVSQNSKIGKLVDDTNAIITEANESGDPTKLNNAKVARDSAISVIQSNENKIIQLKKQLKQIEIYITIFNIIANILGPILLPLPVPSPAPDVVTTPKENFRRRIYEPALKLLNSLSALLPIISNILDRAVDILEDYKTQLLEINGQLESAAANDLNLINNNNGNDFGTVNETYKGFKFAIREDNSFGGISVGGFKRHYAVAIDTNNVDVLRSELSFTLDTNDLIEQLKLVIDQQNLIA